MDRQNHHCPLLNEYVAIGIFTWNYRQSVNVQPRSKNISVELFSPFPVQTLYLLASWFLLARRYTFPNPMPAFHWEVCQPLGLCWNQPVEIEIKLIDKTFNLRSLTFIWLWNILLQCYFHLSIFVRSPAMISSTFSWIV